MYLCHFSRFGLTTALEKAKVDRCMLFSDIQVVYHKYYWKFSQLQVEFISFPGKLLRRCTWLEHEMMRKITFPCYVSRIRFSYPSHSGNVHDKCRLPVHSQIVISERMLHLAELSTTYPVSPIDRS
jgi:hypothetical protein